MDAIQIKQFGAPYQVSRVPKPSPKPNQVLIKIKAGGLCHTDLLVLENAFNSTLPVIGSHEPAGIIEEVGSAVEGFKVGEHVGALNFENPCGKCGDCTSGKPIYCDVPEMKDITADGAWADYMVSDYRFVVKLPDGMPFPVAACLMCAGSTMYGALTKANMPKGSSIAIFGIGGLGHIGTQIGKAMGYKIVAIDAKQSALDLVASYDLKPDACILATDGAEKAIATIESSIKDDSPYPGVDASIVATDAAAAFDMATKITKKHGTLVVVGQPSEGINFSYHTLIFRDIKVVGSLLANTAQAQELVQLVHDAKIQLKIKEWKMEDAEAMKQEYMTGKGDGKNVIVME